MNFDKELRLMADWGIPLHPRSHGVPRFLEVHFEDHSLGLIKEGQIRHAADLTNQFFARFSVPDTHADEGYEICEEMQGIDTEAIVWPRLPERRNTEPLPPPDERPDRPDWYEYAAARLGVSVRPDWPEMNLLVRQIHLTICAAFFDLPDAELAETLCRLHDIAARTTPRQGQ